MKNWIRKIATRFKKGIEYVVEKGLMIFGAYEAVKAAVTAIKTAAPKVVVGLKTAVGKACTYLTTAGFSSSLTSPICALQCANLGLIAAVGIVALSALAIYGIGTMLG
jgi:hypothetical protein